MSSSEMRPLDGVRVLDLGRFVAAPFASQMLGDLGAEVIKIERPRTGDDIRGYGPPFLKAKDGADETSFDFISANRNKKSVTVDITRPEGRDIIRRLAVHSDILVENFKSRHLAKYGLGYEDIRAINPGIIYCSISGFGQTGPYASRPGLDSIFQAASGLMSVTGEPDGPPNKVGTMTCDVTAALYSTIGILAALRHREVNGGAGQHLDMAALETAMAALLVRGQTYLGTGEIPQRLGATTAGNAPAGIFQCEDGQIMITAGSDDQFGVLVRSMGQEGVAQDPRFRSRQLRVVNQGALDAWLNSALTQHPRAYWLEIFLKNGVMCAPINNIGEAFNDPHIKSRGMVVEVEHPRAGNISLIANPIRFSETPIPPFASPPTIGQHTDEILRDVVGFTDAEIVALRGSGAV